MKWYFKQQNQNQRITDQNKNMRDETIWKEMKTLSVPWVMFLFLTDNWVVMKEKKKWSRTGQDWIKGIVSQKDKKTKIRKEIERKDWVGVQFSLSWDLTRLNWDWEGSTSSRLISIERIWLSRGDWVGLHWADVIDHSYSLWLLRQRQAITRKERDGMRQAVDEPQVQTD